VISTDGTVFGTIAVSSGKWYWETVMTVGAANLACFGIAGINTTQAYFANSGTDTGYGYSGTGVKTTNGTAVSYGSTFTVGDVIGAALDLDAGTIAFYKNGVSQGTAYTGISGTFYPAGANGNSSSTKTLVFNFGQRPFAYTAPSGFKALCTTNLSASGTVTTSGTFTGNASTDGPFIYLNGIPTAMTINGNAVTFGTQADKLSNGFKVRSSSSSYNTSGSNTYSVSTTGAIFRYSNAQGNP